MHILIRFLPAKRSFPNCGTKMIKAYCCSTETTETHKQNRNAELLSGFISWYEYGARACPRPLMHALFFWCVPLLRRSNAMWLGPVLSAEQRHGHSTSASLHKCWSGQWGSSSSPTAWHLKAQSTTVEAHLLCVLTQQPTLKTLLGSLYSTQVA